MNPQERKDLILHLLSLEPRLTAVQVARLAYPTEEVEVINGKTYPKTRQSANNMLVRMSQRKAGLLKRQVFDVGKPDLYMLPSTHRLQGDDKRKHQVAGADLFVAFYPHMEKFSGQWVYEPTILEKRADRGMRLFGKTFYFEVDRGTQTSPEVIRKKLDTYTSYYLETREPFHVIFVLVGDDEHKVFNRADWMLKIFEEQKGGNHFLMARHSKLTLHPFEHVIKNSLGKLVSLETL